MKKEKFHREYIFDKVSQNILWNHLTTPTGLSGWFADHVSVDGNIFIFTWNKHFQEAKQIAIFPQSYIRFKWMDEESDDIFFEFKLHREELTGATALEITDFSEPEEQENAISLWDSQIKTLKRTLGI